MIRRLKIKFITLAMAALFVLLALIVTGMNLLNYNSIVMDADRILDLLSQNQGNFPDFFSGKQWKIPDFITIETPYETRFFSVLLSPNGEVIRTDTRQIKAIETGTAIEYAKQAMSSGKPRDFIGDFRYTLVSEDFATRIIFLDCGRKFYSFHMFLFSSICMALIGYLAFFWAILFFSGRILKPVAESYEKQRRFITDAGHELKTPLAIIKANTEVLEMEYGESEWLDGICSQVDRLSTLTADLVYLSRMEEAESSLPMIEFPVSDVVSEAAAAFQAMAQTQNKTFLCNVPPMLSFVGNEKAVRQLVSILVDNALKYAPEQGFISLTLRKTGRQLILSVYNTTREPVQEAQLNHFFERFYRADSSRSSGTGGYGIGLSVAQAITAAHSGKISAQTQDGCSLEITVQLPC